MLAPHRAGPGPRRLDRDHMVVEGNWKLMMENSRECYHCATEHRELMRTFLDIYDWTNPAEMPPRLPAVHRPGATSEGSARVPGGAKAQTTAPRRLPFTRGAVSTTMDGKQAVSRLLGDGVPHHDIGSVRWVHYPSVFNHALGDYADDGSDAPAWIALRTMVTTTWLVDRDARSRASTTTCRT